ncbi:MAG: hypothetical protein AAF799_03660 [Myxococcota bacterium]
MRASLHRPWIGLGLAIGLACGGSSGNEPAPASTDSTGETGGSAGAVADSTSSSSSIPDAPPEVIDVGFDVSLLREAESVVITAVVLDPNDDVSLGELYGPETGSLFGTFEPGLSGRWTITVSWTDVHERWPLSFTDELAVPFVARFVDEAGLEVSAPIDVRAVCGGLRNVACDGECVDIQTSSLHCDACDSPCAAYVLGNWGMTGGCEGGQCRPFWSECFDPTAFSTCNEVCAVTGSRCADGGCLGETSMVYLSPRTCEKVQAGQVQPLECDTALPGPLGFEGAIRCCCG